MPVTERREGARRSGRSGTAPESSKEKRGVPHSERNEETERNVGIEDEPPQRRSSRSRKKKKVPPESLDTERETSQRGSQGDVSESNDDEPERRSRRKAVFDSLHEEMEIAGYAVNSTGQKRKRVPKSQSKSRTRKRKHLEEQDEMEVAVLEEDGTNKLRGSRAAAEERVIQGSLIFHGRRSSLSEGEGEQDKSAVGSDDEGSVDNAEDEDYDEEAEDMEESEEEDEIGSALEEVDGEEEEGETEKVPTSKKPRSKRQETKASRGRGSAGKRRKLYRLRNFKSVKMAQRHGEALGAHAQGKPKEALQKLKALAADAPTAPQIYPSLGMVYEGKLQEMLRKADQTGQAKVGTGGQGDNDEGRVEKSDVSRQQENKLLTEQLDVAKKAYGSYHIAAVLCRRDYTLWLRAGDSAVQISALHTTAMQDPDMDRNVREYHRGEKQRWLQEAKNDYQTADNLNPPGIDIPTKLASVLIDLGHLSEALTLLTDLKNRKKSPGEDATEFESSYRAWLLYADLMLRIGHECTQWNTGFQTNNNYMFRRWLRKFSTMFDWKERRLQALSKALEAACGSKNCSKLVEWLKGRVKGFGHEDDADEEPNAFPHLVEKVDGSIERESANDIFKHKMSGSSNENDDFENEKKLLIDRNQSELNAFDKTTQELDPKAGPEIAKDREDMRHELVEKQKAALVELVAEFHGKERGKQGQAVTPSRLSDGEESAPETGALLPPSASCRTVFTVASELMRHMLGMELYGGALLVGEAVSSYMKERAAMSDRRVEARRRFDVTQTMPVNIFAMHHEAYDSAEEDRDQDVDLIGLSDDDEVDTPANAAFLRRGILPPELRILYGLALICDGGKNFLGVKCLEAFGEMGQEPPSWLSEQVIDTSVTTDTMWLLFYRATTEPLRRTAAYAFAADVLRNSGKESEVSERVAPLFRRHVLELSRNGILDSVFSTEQRMSAFSRQRHDQVIKIYIASMRLEIGMVESIVARARTSADESIQCTVLQSLESLLKLLKFVWKVESNSSLSLTCIDALSALARIFSAVSDYHTQLFGGDNGALRNVVREMMKPVALLCGASDLSVSEGERLPMSELTNIPMADSWLSHDLRLLSIRTHNLCVARNVSQFSGWETEEFSVRLLRGGGSTPGFFGIVMTDGQVTGYLTPSNEEEISKQWQILREQLPDSFKFDFHAKLYALRETARYREMKERYESAVQKHEIGLYGENYGLSALLCFSRLCLLLVKEMKETDWSRDLIFTALSILLPVSQFCINETLWKSGIGQSTSSPSVINDLWNLRTEEKEEDQVVRPSLRRGYVRPSQRVARVAASEQNRRDKRVQQDWFVGENKADPLSNLLSLPVLELQLEWEKHCDSSWSTVNSMTRGLEAMQKLHNCVSTLRTCYTEAAVEKSSLFVAVALLELAACPQCKNPFLCIQQAVLFASQAAKGGTSDSHFQAPLPKHDLCTPLDALVILGRADCLQALYFSREAAFLCGYVATICSSHRKSGGRWRIVAMLAYNTSVIIRTNMTAREQESTKEDSDRLWEESVIEELKRARSDGARREENSAGEYEVLENMEGNDSLRFFLPEIEVTEGEEGQKPANDDDSVTAAEIVAV